MKDNSYKEERIQRLLSMAFGARKSELALSYAVQVLDIDPDVPEALMIKADHTENAEERLEHLQHALNVADNKKNINERKLMIYALKQRTAYTLFTLKRYEEAYKITDSVVNGVIDPYVAEFYEDSIQRYATEAEDRDIQSTFRRAQASIQRRDSSFDGYIGDIRKKCYGILWGQDWFIIDRFKDEAKCANDYMDSAKFNQLVIDGTNAIANNQIMKLRDILGEIYRMPKKAFSRSDENNFVNIIRG